MLIVKIHNDGTGTKVIGNYDVSVCVNQEEIWNGRVEGYRRRQPWQYLLQEVLCAALCMPGGSHDTHRPSPR